MAELKYHASMLKQKQALEREEVLLIQKKVEDDLRRDREMGEIKWKREMMEVEAELAIAQARLDVIIDYDERKSSSGQSYSDVAKWVMSNQNDNGCSEGYAVDLSRSTDQFDLADDTQQMQQGFIDENKSTHQRHVGGAGGVTHEIQGTQ